MKPTLNTKQAAVLTGIPAVLLRRMRCRESRTLRGGPPYHRSVTGTFSYRRKELEEWMRMRRCIITRGDAAALLDCSTDEICAYAGQRSFELRGKKNGRLIVNNGKNFFMWIPMESN